MARSDPVLEVPSGIGRGRSASRADLALRVLAAVTLGVDGYVHAIDASFYTASRGGALTQSTLFLIETVAAALAAAVLLLGWRVPTLGRVSWLAAFTVGASALGGVVLYRYVNVGALGPIPNMYEPTWAVRGKLLSAYAEATATALTAVGYLRASYLRSGRS